MNGKGAAAILLLHPPSGKGGGMGYGGGKDAAPSKDDGGDEEADVEGADYDKILLSSAKDILDANDPKALKSALYEFVAACIKKEQDEGEG